MEIKHTSGPWELIDENGRFLVRTENSTGVVLEWERENGKPSGFRGTTVARVTGMFNGSGEKFGPHKLMSDDELKANAKLIAAAPELAEALKPFAHEDLGEILGGNAMAGESIVFQRNRAILKIKDFIAAAKALKKAGII